MISRPDPAVVDFGQYLSCAQLRFDRQECDCRNPTRQGPWLCAFRLEAGSQQNRSGKSGRVPGDPPAGTVLATGWRTLTAFFTPDPDSGDATATVSVGIFVNQAVPAITWSTPASIAYGTGLSGAQLDASSPVAGTFVYSPPAGTALGPGSHALNVNFTPTDVADYLTANASGVLMVKQATPSISWPVPSAISYGTPLGTAQLDATSPVPGTFTYNPSGRRGAQRWRSAAEGYVYAGGFDRRHNSLRLDDDHDHEGRRPTPR